MNWWDRVVGRHEPLDNTPLREDIVAVVSDNVNYNVGALKRQLPPRFSNARHVRCIVHVLHFVGTVFRDHKALAVNWGYMSHTCSFLLVALVV